MSAGYEEEELFAAAMALPASERVRYLERACAGDGDLLARLRSLIEASHHAALFIREQSSVSRDGVERIGPYRILQELGEGGCGVAYLAEQTTPVRREVALKVIKPGMDTKAVIARFEAERQALAMMDHPNVAKVFDGGATPTGRPYFVMELVRGIRITEFCDQSRLSVRERLALFIQVCHAIQHAHLKGIIHRDIKPSNVLVTMHDGTAIAKVIDFGIAKAMQGRLSDATVLTVMDQFIGTPAYVSPEQNNPGAADIDTRTDVYSLGVLLYELLTSCTPFDASQLQQDGLDRMRQRVRDEEPPTPSKRLSTLDAELITRTAERRQSIAARLTKHIQGDLDWIVMRCLEKERTRRYQTANDLVLDLQRYLQHEPVLARPPSLVYVVRKFARRRRVMFAATLVGIVFVLFIIAFAIVTSIQTQRIAAERERARQEGTRAETVSEFMLQIFDAAQPFTSLGREISAREVLDEAGRRIRSDLQQHPEVRAQLLEAIGRAYRRQGQPDRAISFLREALDVRTRMPVDSAKTALAHVELSMALRQAGDLEGADRAMQRALHLSKQQNMDQRSAAYAMLLTNLGRVELQAGRSAAAKDHFEQSLTLNRELLGSQHTEVANLHMELAGVFLWDEDFKAAEREARRAVDIYGAAMPGLHPDRVLANVRLADALLVQNRLDEATSLFQASLQAQRQLYGENSRQVADVLDSLGKIKRSQGQLAEAEDFARQALRAHEQSLGKENFMTAYFGVTLGATLSQRGKWDEAERLLRDGLAVFDRTLPEDHQYVAAAEHHLGLLLLATNRLPEAEAVLTAAMNRWRRAGAPAWRWARSAGALGEVLYRDGRTHEGEQHVADSYRTLAADENADVEARIESRERLVRVYTDSGQRDKLRQILSSSFDHVDMSTQERD